MGCANSSAGIVQPAHGQDARRAGPHRVIQLNRAAGVSLGLHVSMAEDGIHAREVVEGGLTARWNSQHPSMKVGRGDRILSVNGVEANGAWSSWHLILRELRKDSVELVLAPRAARSMQPQESSTPARVDHLLPPGFMDSFSQGLDGACNAADGCPICLEELEDDPRTVQLPCGHAFHFNCAESWLTRCPTSRHASCPTCRARVSGGGCGRKFSDGSIGTVSTAVTSLDALRATASEEDPCIHQPCIMCL